MSQYTTIVIQMPSDDRHKKVVQQALAQLSPYQVAMSLEDEMTLLELIEQHDDFPSHIADEARTRMAELHAAAESAK